MNTAPLSTGERTSLLSPRTGESRVLAGSAALMIQQSRRRCSSSEITLVRSRAILAESALTVRRGEAAIGVLAGVGVERRSGQPSPSGADVRAAG